MSCGLIAFPFSGTFRAALVVSASLLPSVSNQACAADVETTFRADVEPVLARCLECHGAKRTSGLDLRTRATALEGGDNGVVLIPGNPEESSLYQYVASGDMPPQHPLSKDEIAVLRRWIADGAWFPDRTLDRFAFTTDHWAGYDWWSLQPVQASELPAVHDAGRPVTPIDRFVVARLEQDGLQLSPPADRATLLKRVTIDLTGLLPTRDEIEGFVNDTRPDGYEKVVDRLLASPHYGQRWGRHWLDVVRYAESNGFERNRVRLNFWRFRDYVIGAFNQDKPYDQFVREQLAGDAFDPDNPECLIATGFLVAGPKNDVKTDSQLQLMKRRQDEIDEFVSVVSTTFLGLTVGCGRCHDHKFDPITSQDYYGLAAVFSGLDRLEKPVASPQETERHARAVAAAQAVVDQKKGQLKTVLDAARARLVVEWQAADVERTMPKVAFDRNEDRFEPCEARFIRFEIWASLGNAKPCLDELEVYGSEYPERNLTLAGAGAQATASSVVANNDFHQVSHLNDGRYGNAYSWVGNEQGQGSVEIELAQIASVDRVVWGRDRHGKYLDRIPTGYTIQVSLDREAWHTVSSSDRRVPFDESKPQQPAPSRMSDEKLLAALSAEQRAAHDQVTQELAGAEEALKNVPPLPVSYISEDGDPQPTFVLERGNVLQRGEQVGPAALRAIKSLNPDLALAAENDSGPERRRRLAEWIVDSRNPLTSRVFVNRLWHYHFGQGIVNTPSDFGWGGDRPSHPELLDWLAADFMEHGWRIKRLQRMIVLSAVYRQGSEFNDQAAARDGANRLLWRWQPRRLEAEVLRDAILQVSGQLDLSFGGPSFRLFRYIDGNVPEYLLLEDPGKETWRRAVYMFNIHTFATPLMGAFDCADATNQVPRRLQTVTAPQALSLLNNPFVFEQSEYFSRRVAAAAGSEPEEQAVVAYQLALARNPTVEETAAAARFIRDHDLFSLCRILFNTNEFLYVF